MHSGSPAQELPYSQNYTTAVNTDLYALHTGSTEKLEATEQATEHEFNSHDARSTSEQRWIWVIFRDA